MPVVLREEFVIYPKNHYYINILLEMWANDQQSREANRPLQQSTDWLTWA